MRNTNKLLQPSINDFDENEDIILPNSYFGELIYIAFCVLDIIKNKNNRTEKFNNLKRQITLHRKWMKLK